MPMYPWVKMSSAPPIRNKQPCKRRQLQTIPEWLWCSCVQALNVHSAETDKFNLPYLFIFFFPTVSRDAAVPPHPPASSFLHAYARHQAGDGWKPALSPACCCWEHQQAYQGLSLISMSSLFCLVSWQQLTETATRHLDVAASSCRREAAPNLQPAHGAAFCRRARRRLDFKGLICNLNL